MHTTAIVPRKRPRRSASRALLAFAATSLLFTAGCDQATSTPTEPDPLVRVVAVAPAALEETAFTGTIAARVQSSLGFRVGGKIIERLVDTGEVIRAGTPIYRIDPTDYDHAIAAQLGNVAAAKARLIQAAADEKRYRNLLPTRAVSVSDYDAAKAAADSARALLDAAQAQLLVVQDDRRYTTLVADADGTVVETLAEPGQVVSAGQIVAGIAHTGPREASISLPETIRPRLGSAAQASLYGGDGRWPARLRQLSDAADPQTRTFEARFILEGDAAGAPLGATVTIWLSNEASAQKTSVPLGALIDEGNETGVWILDDKSSTVTFRPVRIDQLGAETAVLNSGIATGERVVALGAHLLHEGQRVRTSDFQAGRP
ncbi:efflux RND transporter periplasmic adaptor subunit [Dongia sp.]|uniref:efflux RND transporter periplasmic adaptor subunit n=1 Tax=Dongia sp. TaxID=1977262 RepID=UPI0035B2A0E5